MLKRSRILSVLLTFILFISCSDFPTEPKTPGEVIDITCNNNRVDISIKLNGYDGYFALHFPPAGGGGYGWSHSGNMDNIDVSVHYEYVTVNDKSNVVITYDINISGKKYIFRVNSFEYNYYFDGLVSINYEWL